MFKGFKIDTKGQKRRMMFQERQRLQQQFVNDSKKSSHYGYWEQNEGQTNKFATRLIK